MAVATSAPRPKDRRRLASGASPLYLKACLHHGSCIAVTMNDRLDYFGSVVNMAVRFELLSSGEEIILSEVVRQDPEVAEFLAAQDNDLAVERFEAQLMGFDTERFRLWRVRCLARDGSGDSS